MALVVKDRVRETSTTTGTGTFTLAGAVSGFQTFSSAIGNTNTTYYTIIGGTEWETGLGTVAAGTLARTTVLESSNAGSAVNFSAGTKDVFGTYPASKALYKDASGNAIGLGTVAATTTLTSAVGLPLSTGVTGTLPIANGGTGTTATAHTSLTTNVTGTLPVANGGTSLATLTANNVLLGNGTSAPTFVAPSTSGNLLTSNGTTWTSSTPATPNTAGGASTVSQGTSLTLTSASNRVQNVSFTAASLSVTLPDATTLSAGGPTFIISNTGVFGFDIKLNDGSILVTLNGGQSSNLTLLSTATSNGTWNTNYSPIVAAQFAPLQIDSNAILTNQAALWFWRESLSNSDMSVLKLTSTTALITWIRSSNNSVYGAVVTNTSGTLTIGTIVQIYNGSTTAAVSFTTQLLTGLTTGMCFVTRASTAVAMPFSISGTTITVGTTSATFGFWVSERANGGRIVEGAAVMSSTVILISYMLTSQANFVVNTVTYNGASAPTLGTASVGTTAAASANVGDNGPYLLVPLTATTAQLWYWTTSTNLATRIVTTAGVGAPTFGTAINSTTAALDFFYNYPIVYAYSATETVIKFNLTYTSTVATVISYTVSGTTVTVQNTTNILPISGSTPTWVNSTTGYYVDSLISNSALDNLTSGLYKYVYVAGSNLYSYGYYTPAQTTYMVIQAVAGLSTTTGVLSGYTSSYILYANALNFV